MRVVFLINEFSVMLKFPYSVIVFVQSRAIMFGKSYKTSDRIFEKTISSLKSFFHILQIAKLIFPCKKKPLTIDPVNMPPS